MQKIVLIPDSFKGTLTSIQICSIMEAEIHKHFPNCEVVSIPVADGGEGSVDCFLAALGGKKVSIIVKNPYLEDMEAFYGILADGQTAVIEMAACAGLPLVEDRKNPMLTSTYGVGELILDAVNQGCKKIIVGLGGSCTNDAGVGAAAALGVKFYNVDGEPFIPTGGTLKDVVRINIAKKVKALEDVEIITMCDINNPLYGDTGAAYVFAPQKGADETAVKMLDEGLVHISKIIQEYMKINVSAVPGGGAAGGMGAGMVAFFDSTLQMGIETVLETVRFRETISDAELIFTGEGKMDSQSLRGKVVIGVAKQAKEQQIPVVVITGGYDNNIENAYDMGVTAVFSINRLPEDLSISRFKSSENLTLLLNNILKLMQGLAKK